MRQRIFQTGNIPSKEGITTMKSNLRIHVSFFILPAVTCALLLALCSGALAGEALSPRYGAISVQGQIFAYDNAGPCPVTSCAGGQFLYPYMYKFFTTNESAVISGTGALVNFWRFSAFLNAFGLGAADLAITFGISEFDASSHVWDPVTRVEERLYTGGDWVILVDGVPLIGGPMPDLSVTIEYQTDDCLDDLIYGSTGFVLRSQMAFLVDPNGPLMYRLLAKALAADIGANGGIKLIFDTIQPAFSEGYFLVGTEEAPGTIALDRKAALR